MDCILFYLSLKIREKINSITADDEKMISKVPSAFVRMFFTSIISHIARMATTVINMVMIINTPAANFRIKL